MAMPDCTICNDAGEIIMGSRGLQPCPRCNHPIGVRDLRVGEPSARPPRAGDSMFQRLWTKYAGRPDYVKDEWTAAFNQIWGGGRGVRVEQAFTQYLVGEQTAREDVGNALQIIGGAHLCVCGCREASLQAEDHDDVVRLLKHALAQLDGGAPQ